jgi:transposase
MVHYAALDVSDKETAIHVLDEHGKPVWRGKRPSEPEALATALRRHAPELERVGLETGRLAPWLYHSLKALGVPVVCLDARHARAATALQRNKTDARDAETLAQLVRTGWYREARVKGWAAHVIRHLVGARAQLVGISADLSNQIRSALRTFGLRVDGGAGRVFEAKVGGWSRASPWRASSSRCLRPGAPSATKWPPSIASSSKPPGATRPAAC